MILILCKLTSTINKSLIFIYFISVDLVSYEANRKLLLETCSKKPIKHDAAQELAMLTFDGQRAKLMADDYSVDNVLQDMMPLLNNTTHVRK